MCWLKGEPKLRDVLADPVIQLMMRRDQVDPDRLHAFLCHVGGTLRGTAPQGSAARFICCASSGTDALTH